MLTREQQSFVELNRRFRKLEQNAKVEEAAIESYTAASLWRLDTLSWDELLQENRAVLLGEPGSGKSWELRERARLLTGRGAFAFFVRLDQLVDHELRTLLSADQHEHLMRWKKGTDVAYFFLDSVDEAKFRKVSDFHATLNRFRNELGDDFLLRTKIFLSSRISEWKPSTDSFEFQRLFPLPRREKRASEGESKTVEPPKSAFLVLQLEPLDRDQVECFARANGVPNVRAFIGELDRAFAWEFARRPLDVADLIGYWNEKGRIGSLTELIEFDVSSKLRPRMGRDEHPLSETEGREGVEWLAAATVFSRRFFFAVPDDGFANTDSLNTRACLPSRWRDDQIRALLNRAVFDSAVYGHFRFHHRRVGEYLAAKWIAARMERGCPPHVLEQLLAEVLRGRKVLRPSLHSVAAWLCCGNDQWNHLTRDLIVETDPGLHLRYGDPGSLSIEYRRQILTAMSRTSKGRTRMWIESSPDCLARLADSALSAEIAGLILDRTLAVDFRIELLDIVRHGRLSGCLNAALRVVASDKEPVELRCHAADAIGGATDVQSHARLVEIVHQLPQVPNRLCASIVKALFPKIISSVELEQLLLKTEPVKEFSVDLPFHLKSHFKSVLTPENAGDLLQRLLELIQTPPLIKHGEKTLPVSDRLSWIGEVIPTILEILFCKPSVSVTQTETAAKALQLLGHLRECHILGTEDFGDLNKATLKHLAVRRNYLWNTAAAFRKEYEKEPTMAVELFDHWEVLRLHAEDFSWLIDDVTAQNNLEDRILALRLAIDVWDSSGRQFRSRWRLHRSARRDDSLRDVLRQSVVVSPLFPIQKFWWRKVRFGFGQWWWWSRKSDSVIKFWRWTKEQSLLLRNLRLIESGKQLRWLELLSREADKENHTHWTPSKWTDLEKKRGKWITRAAKRGCMAAWRNFSPPLPHEKPEPNQTSIGVLVGLTGLKVEFEENPTGIAELSQAEAKLAARYAMDELNGFPIWFEELATTHPNAVADVLAECIKGEWAFAAEREETHEVLSRLAWQGEHLLPLVQDKLLSLLSAGDPPNRSILRFAISALMRKNNQPPRVLADLAANRATSESNLSTMVLWLAVWMHIDGEAAASRLETILTASEKPDDIVIRLCSLLSGEEVERGPFAANPSYLRLVCLRRFIPVVYRHVRFSDDLDRSGGPYSPGARDHAQRFRSVLLNRLETDEDFAATDVLRQLADEPVMSPVRDWILNLIDKRLLNEADSAPWTPADIREFADNHEFDPKNDRELFAIAQKRLQVLRWDVEQSDNSLRDELRREDRELLLRRWVQRRLMERSQKRYNIPQEEEIDRQERPDLRLENPKVTGPVSIEVKWADSWTLPELLERLETQLVGQYLRAHNSRYGIYLLGFIGKKQSWEEPTTGKLLTFPEVVDIVTQRAFLLMRNNPTIAGLDVVSIDFRPPN